jgi:hypothetical protein
MKPAPFFLPTQPGPDIKFIAPSEPVPEIEVAPIIDQLNLIHIEIKIKNIVR